MSLKNDTIFSCKQNFLWNLEQSVITKSAGALKLFVANFGKKKTNPNTKENKQNLNIASPGILKAVAQGSPGLQQGSPRAPQLQKRGSSCVLYTESLCSQKIKSGAGNYRPAGLNAIVQSVS